MDMFLSGQNYPISPNSQMIYIAVTGQEAAGIYEFLN